MGTVDLPQIIGDIKPNFPVYVDTNAIYEFQISFRNELMQKARRQVEAFIIEKNRERFMKGDKAAQQN